MDVASYGSGRSPHFARDILEKRVIHGRRAADPVFLRSRDASVSGCGSLRQLAGGFQPLSTRTVGVLGDLPALQAGAVVGVAVLIRQRVSARSDRGIRDVS